MQWIQWDGRFLDKMVDLGWVVIRVRWGDNGSAFPWLGDRWHEKIETKIQNINHWVIIQL